MQAEPQSPGGTELQGRVAWVIGASKGIGAEAARAFSRHGAEVVLSSRDVDGLDGTVGQIGAAGGKARALPLDLTVGSSITEAARAIDTAYGRLDFAFNNAGEGHRPTDLADVPIDAFQRVIDVTVRGTFLALREQIPRMLRSGGGAIVNMASTAGISAYRGGGPYVAAKHAVLGLTKAAAVDYAERGVRVNAVAPGPILSHRLRDLPTEYLDRARQAVPMRRLGTEAEVAETVVWLCSDSAKFITGATVAIDGGRLAGWA